MLQAGNCPHEPCGVSRRASLRKLSNGIVGEVRDSGLWNMEHLDLRLSRAQPPFKLVGKGLLLSAFLRKDKRR